MTLIRLLTTIYVLIIVACTVSAEQPVINLHEGINTVTISVVNTWDKNLSDISFHTEKEDFPEWLSVKNQMRTLNVRSGEKSAEGFLLICEVTDAPVNAEAILPFSFVDTQGNHWTFTASVRVGTDKPSVYELYENYPNPFNPSTTISYSLKDTRQAQLDIFNMLGQRLRTLVNKEQAAGIHTVQWDGRNDDGNKVSSGVYFYRLKAGDFVRIKRMILVE